MVYRFANAYRDFTVDYIPWFSPDSVDETNYKRFFYRELPEHLNKQYRDKGSDQERKIWVQDLVRISPGWFAVELPEEGSADAEAREERRLGDDGKGLRDGDRRPPPDPE